MAVRFRFWGLGVIAILTSGGCTEYGGSPLKPTVITRWDFDMGSQGGGVVRFSANGPENGAQTGECLTPVCHTRIEDGASLFLEASPNDGFVFTRWTDDPARGLPCDSLLLQRPGPTRNLVVTRDGACYAVFEPVRGGPTAPGVRASGGPR